MKNKTNKNSVVQNYKLTGVDFVFFFCFGLFSDPSSKVVPKKLSYLALNCTMGYLRNRKRFLCFHKVMVKQVELWKNERSCKKPEQ